jgi:hypothetical protein
MKPKFKILTFIILFIIVLGGVFALWTIQNKTQWTRLQDITSSGSRLKKVNLPNKNIDNIDVWMTFAYINKVFWLPNNLFAEALKITDVRYPNISLRNHIKENNLDTEIFLKQIKEMVHLSAPESNDK